VEIPARGPPMKHVQGHGSRPQVSLRGACLRSSCAWRATETSHLLAQEPLTIHMHEALRTQETRACPVVPTVPVAEPCEDHQRGGRWQPR
jgi:hypothetical protein